MAFNNFTVKWWCMYQTFLDHRCTLSLLFLVSFVECVINCDITIKWGYVQMSIAGRCQTFDNVSIAPNTENTYYGKQF